jgi:hypothetical protein
MSTPMTSEELRDLRRLLGKLRDDMGLDDGTVYRGREIDAVDGLAAEQLEDMLPTPGAAERAAGEDQDGLRCRCCGRIWSAHRITERCLLDDAAQRRAEKAAV